MKIYISGKITGNEDNYKENFAKAKAIVEDMGYEAVSPIDDETPENVAQWKKWEDYMRKDIKKLMDCDGVFYICDNMAGKDKGWQESKGAMIEYKLAVSLGFKNIFSDDEEIARKYGLKVS